ncbi:MAG: sigma-70 family RNA polymerase sigma factor [Phycisphaerales bacterium]
MRELTRAIARGDEAAFERFYNDWFEPAYAMARRLTRRDESFCLDVVQDAMLRAAKSIKPLDMHDQLAAWVRRVVHTAALDRLRAERRRLARERASYENHPALAPLDERIEWIRAELAKLPPEERSLLSMRFGRDKTLETTAAAHSMTPGAAHGRVRRLLARLRDVGGGDT